MRPFKPGLLQTIVRRHRLDYGAVRLDRTQCRGGDCRKVFCLPGNHEFYGCPIERLAKEMTSAAEEVSVGLLAPGTRDVADARVIRVTLWTDCTTSCRNKVWEPNPTMMRQGMFANACQRALNEF